MNIIDEFDLASWCRFVFIYCFRFIIQNNLEFLPKNQELLTNFLQFTAHQTMVYLFSSIEHSIIETAFWSYAVTYIFPYSIILLIHITCNIWKKKQYSLDANAELVRVFFVFSVYFPELRKWKLTKKTTKVPYICAFSTWYCTIQVRRLRVAFLYFLCTQLCIRKKCKQGTTKQMSSLEVTSINPRIIKGNSTRHCKKKSGLFVQRLSVRVCACAWVCVWVHVTIDQKEDWRIKVYHLKCLLGEKFVEILKSLYFLN